MESKLPKPTSMRKLQTVLPKTILPTDRIKPSAFGHGTISKSENGAKNFSPKIASPLYHSHDERAMSPDLSRDIENHGNRTKLRRSRSACDINIVRPSKRIESTLAPIPAKFSRYLQPSSAMSSMNNNVVSRPLRIGSTTVSTASGSSSTSHSNKRTVLIKPSSAKTTATGDAGKRKLNDNVGTSASISTSTTCAGKPIIKKKIPSYDYKSRFHELQEKHKTLKEKYDANREEMCNLECMPEQLEESQAELFATKDQLRNAQTKIECLERQVKSQVIKIDSITNCLEKTKDELEKLKEKHTKIYNEHSTLSAENVDLRERNEMLTEKYEEVLENYSLCKEQVFRSNMERKELHNAVLDLRGNIRVFCRVRPPLSHEQDKILCGWNYLDEATVEVQSKMNTNKPLSHTFSFDHVFHQNSMQEDVFEMVSPLIQSALDGYNICIFAYGQTGSGKTYTMDGIPSKLGVIPRTVDLLFDSIENYKRFGWKYEISVTFLEIYNEVLYDLLSNEQKDMEIRMVKNNKNEIYVSNITRETVASAEHLRSLMQTAKMNRATASTVNNDRSSRSHAVTKIELIGTHDEKNEMSIGSINLVDLAGSESPKTSTRMNETKNINRSLSELTNVILALLQKQDHIPYRNSKLTHLLMPSLGGNSKTLMFINVAPLQDCLGESLNSLRFGANANLCKMAKAKRNKFLNNTSLNNSFT